MIKGDYMGFKLIKHKKNKKIVHGEYALGIYRLEDLNTYESLVLKNKLKENELENLKYLNENNKLYLECEAHFSLNDIIIKLKEFGKNNKIILEISDKEIFNKFIFNVDTLNYDNIAVKTKDFVVCPLNEYIYFEKLLYRIVEPAKDLSPFEKYIYSFNVVKNFKDYKESEKGTGGETGLGRG